MWSTVTALALLIVLIIGVSKAIQKYGDYRAEKKEIKLVKKYKRLSNEEKAEFIKSVKRIYGSVPNDSLKLRDGAPSDLWSGETRTSVGSKPPKVPNST